MHYVSRIALSFSNIAQQLIFLHTSVQSGREDSSFPMRHLSGILPLHGSAQKKNYQEHPLHPDSRMQVLHMTNIMKQTGTCFSIVKRSKGQPTVEKASYISRSVLVSKFDGQTCRPKYHENLVHSEITLLQCAQRVCRPNHFMKCC